MVLWPHVRLLPPRQRAVIVLRYYEDLTEGEIADALGCSRGNVKSTAHRALKALRAALGPNGTDGPDGRERLTCPSTSRRPCAESCGEVAESVRVPAVPRLTQEPSRARWRWQPLLVAAAVALIVAGAVALVARMGGGPEPAPTPPSPSPSRTESVGTIPTTPPTVPYVLDQRLYVDGEQVPGTWWSVQAGEAGWLALRTDDTWWWGSGPMAQRLGGQLEGPPAISPNGRYVAETLGGGRRGPGDRLRHPAQR